MSLFKGEEGHFVEATTANELKHIYEQRKRAVGLADGEIIRSEFFGAVNVQKLLAQPGCVGIRIIHAKRWEDDDGNPVSEKAGRLTPRVVLVGVDKQGHELDLVDQAPAGLKDMPGAGRSQLALGPVCPPTCAGGGGK